MGQTPDGPPECPLFENGKTLFTYLQQFDKKEARGKRSFRPFKFITESGFPTHMKKFESMDEVRHRWREIEKRLAEEKLRIKFC